MSRVPRVLVASLTLTLATAPIAAAQDTWYWRQNYGTEATLLNGMVIGRATDLSTLFYNPAGLAEVDNPTVLLTAKVYEYFALRAQGEDTETGEPINLGAATLRPAPSFLGGTVPFKGLGRHRLGYSILTRTQTDERLGLRLSLDLDVIPSAPGEERLASEVLLSNRTNETWVGLTWAYPVTERLALGATMFVAVRGQLRRNQVTSQALGADGTVGILSGIREAEYNTWRLVPKVGAMLDLRPVFLGLTVTVPSVRLFGGGTGLFNETSTGLDLDGNGTRDDQFAASYQPERSATFKNGLAIGLGGAVDLGATTLYASGEWFAPVTSYEVIALDPVATRLPVGTVPFEFRHAAQSVVNAGVGVRHSFSPRLAGYASFATDQASADQATESNVGTGYWDLYHVGGGTQFQLGKLNLVLGATYTWGGDDFTLSGTFDDPVLSGETVRVSERGVRVLLGFQYGFGSRDSQP